MWEWKVLIEQLLLVTLSRQKRLQFLFLRFRFRFRFRIPDSGFSIRPGKIDRVLYKTWNRDDKKFHTDNSLSSVTRGWKLSFKSECTEKSSKIGKSWPQLKT